MMKMRRLTLLWLGAFITALAVFILMTFTGNIILVGNGCVLLMIGLVGLGMGLAPWGDEP